MKCVGIDLSLRLSRVILKASRPSLTGMFVYMLLMSIDIGIAEAGRVPFSFISSRIRSK